jgi:hypothetical protein
MYNEVDENTHFERLNGTIKSQYLYSKEINNRKTTGGSTGSNHQSL